MRFLAYQNRAMIGEIMRVNTNVTPPVTMMGYEANRKQPKFVAHFAHTTASIQAAQRLRAEIISTNFASISMFMTLRMVV